MRVGGGQSDLQQVESPSKASDWEETQVELHASVYPGPSTGGGSET